jgi:parallel beta-helix repeat protein
VRRVRNYRICFEPLEHRRVLATLWVDPSVTPTPTIFSHIADAVAAAHSGDTIKVVPGFYYESVDITKTLTLIGGQVRVQGSLTTESASVVASTGFDPYGFRLRANSVTIKNFTFEQETIDGIETNGSFSGFSILHNRFLGDATGITLATSSATTARPTTISGDSFADGVAPVQSCILSHGGLANVTISNNTSNVNNATTIDIDGTSPSANVKILNNRITGGQGITIANATKAKIDGNLVGSLANFADAIQLAGAVTNSEVAGNTLIGFNPANADQAEAGISLDESKATTPDTGNKISGNTFTGAPNAMTQIGTGFMGGISLENATHNTISGNIVAYAGVGINLGELSDFNTISSNAVTKNGVGIAVDGSEGNMLSKNIANSNASEGISIENNVQVPPGMGAVLKGNTANFNQIWGINLITSQCKVTGNTANFNVEAGIHLDGGSDNMLSGNTANANLRDGFEVLDGSTGNVFSANATNGNFHRGFDVESMSNSNTFTKNTARNNGDAGFFIQSDANMLLSNTASGNGLNGMTVSGASNVVKGNMLTNNFGDGITGGGQLDTISSNIVKNNQVSGIQIQLLSSTISGNLVMNNGSDGILALSSTSGNTISGNTAMGNGDAFGGFDLVDLSMGTGTAMTANIWLNNKAQTRSPAQLL